MQSTEQSVGIIVGAFAPNIYIFDHYMSREELKMGVVSYVKGRNSGDS